PSRRPTPTASRAACGFPASRAARSIPIPGSAASTVVALKASRAARRKRRPCATWGRRAMLPATLPEEGYVADSAEFVRWVDEGAKAFGLGLAPQFRAKVFLNVERSLAIAQPLLAVELDDELTPAPVFRA